MFLFTFIVDAIIVDDIINEHISFFFTSQTRHKAVLWLLNYNFSRFVLLVSLQVLSFEPMVKVLFNSKHVNFCTRLTNYLLWNRLEFKFGVIRG